MAYCDYKDGEWYSYPEYTPNRQTSYKVCRNGEKPDQAQLVGWNDGRWQRLFRNEAGDLQIEDYHNVASWQHYEVKIRVW
jgi:hypothetical protein